MKAIKNILFPTDFSVCAEQAFRYAAELAARFDANIHELHAVEYVINHPTGTLPTRDQAVRGRIRVHTPVEGALRLGDGAYRLVDLHTASAQDAILTYAQEHEIDLIVMGTHGRRGLGRMMLGSVAQGVLRAAPCPVMTVGERSAAMAPAMSHYLVPHDFSANAREALRYAGALAEHTGGRVDLLHVVQDLALPGVYTIDEVTIPEVKGRALEALERLQREAEHVPEGVPVRSQVLLGYASRAIAAYAREQQHHLIVMGTLGLTGLKNFLLGSVAEQLVRTAPCPVLTLRHHRQASQRSSAADEEAQPEPQEASTAE